MSLIQAFLLLFALFAVTRTIRQFRQGTLPLAWLFVWIVFWLLVAVVGLSPQTADWLARSVGVGRGADVIIYLSLMAVFYLVFRLFVKIEHVEREVTTLVRTIALKEEEKKDI